jgi:hypothetical protein
MLIYLVTKFLIGSLQTITYSRSCRSTATEPWPCCRAGAARLLIILLVQAMDPQRKSCTWHYIAQNDCILSKNKAQCTFFSFLESFQNKAVPQHCSSQYALKGPCHEIFDLRFFSSNNSIWAADPRAKAFLHMVSDSRRYSTMKSIFFV